MVDIIQKQKATMEERQGTFPFRVRRKHRKIREQLDAVPKVLHRFQGLGSVLANMDLLHAGILWAGVNLILQSAWNDSEQHSAALDGLAQVWPIVARYTEIEVMYTQEKGTSLEKDFGKGPSGSVHRCFRVSSSGSLPLQELYVSKV